MLKLLQKHLLSQALVSGACGFPSKLHVMKLWQLQRLLTDPFGFGKFRPLE